MKPKTNPDRRHGRDVRQEDAHPQGRAEPHLPVEQIGDQQRDQQLGHRRDEEQAEGDEHGVPELVVLKQFNVVVEPDEPLVAADQAPLVQGDPRGVDQGEEPEQPKQDEEGRNVKVGRGLHVEPAQAAPAGLA